jgi:large subunit ribosomal protein L10
MSKVIKRMVIDELRSRLGDARDLLVINVSKLDGVTANRTRLQFEQKGVTLLTVKNTLAALALNELGVKGLDKHLAGPSTLVWGGEDIVQLSKEIAKWAKGNDKIEIKGGTVDGQVIDAKGVDELSKSPSRVELISQIVGLVLSPGRRLAGALLGPGGRVAGAIKTMADKDGEAAGGGEPAAEAAPT